MAELIIKIPDKFYETIKSDKYGVHQGRIYDIIRNGTPLPSSYVTSRQVIADSIANTVVNGGSLGYVVASEILSDLPPIILSDESIKYFDTLYKLAQAYGVSYSFVRNEIEEIEEKFKALPPKPKM